MYDRSQKYTMRVSEIKQDTDCLCMTAITHNKCICNSAYRTTVSLDTDSLSSALRIVRDLGCAVIEWMAVK